MMDTFKEQITPFVRGANLDANFAVNEIVNIHGEQLKQERNKAIDEIKKHIGYRSYDVDGMPVVIEVQKLQQYLTSLKQPEAI